MRYFYYCNSIMKINKDKVYLFDVESETWKKSFLPANMILNHGKEIPESDIMLEML